MNIFSTQSILQFIVKTNKHLVLLFALFLALTTRSIAQECPVSNEISLIIVQDPSVQVTPLGATVCMGGTVSLTADTVGGTGGCTLQWQQSADGINWTDISGAIARTYVTPALTVGSNFRVIYRCANGIGCDVATSATVTIQVVNDPTIVLQPQDITECVGGSMGLVVSATGGTPALSYQWQVSDDGTAWVNVPSATSPNYTPLSTVVGVRYYRVVVSASGAGCSDAVSAVSTVTVVADPVVTASVNDAFICRGDSVRLTATVSGGTGIPTFQWQISTDGSTWTNITGATASIYEANALTQNTSFRCIVRQESGCETVSAAVAVTVDACNATLGNFVWNDANANGIQDPNEQGIDGVTVLLTGTATDGGAISRTVTTSGGGAYVFDNLPPGTYQVRFITPSGFNPSPRDMGSDAVDSDPDPATGRTANITLASGENNTTVDAGYYAFARLGDFAFFDCDKDGMKGSNERGMSGVTVTLSGVDGLGNNVSRSTVTNSSGAYFFDNLVPGTYTVTFAYPTTPTGLAFSPQGRGSDRTIDSDVNPATGATNAITLVGGQVNNDIDAGLMDVTPPVITLAAQNRVVECDGMGNTAALQAWLSAQGGATATDNIATNIVWTNNFTSLSDECAMTGSATVIFTATDDCGNSTTTTATFRIEDTTPPTFANVPSNVTVECTNMPNATNPSVSDACDANVSLRMNEVRTNGTCADSYTVTRTWTATDACGNSATTSQVITVEDRTAPIFANVPQNITVECSNIPTATNPTATDNCDASVNITMTENRTNGSCSDAYTLTRVWTATDNCGNTATASQVITIQDRTAPTFANVLQNITVECANIPTATNPTTTDNCDASVTLIMNEVRTNGSCSDAYTLTRTWTATDNCGNSATASQVITVQDRTAPTFANVPQNVTVECSNIPTATNPTATDNCDASVNITMNEIRTNGTCTDNYTLTRTWTATDNCGNMATASQIITVQDRTAPTFTVVPSNITVECSNIPTPATPSVTDNCDTDVTITMNENRTNGSCSDAYTLTRVWTATDNCGNTATASQVITVQDRTAPTFANVPQNITVECANIPTATNPTATDNCDASVNITMTENRTNGTCADAYTLTRVWTATDNCGNTSTASQVITIQDRTAPIFANVPQNITVECANIPNAINPTATDNCDTDVTITMNENRTNGSCSDAYTLTRVWTATDNCGNTSTASQVITVEDRTAPIFANVPQNITVECANIPNAINPTATDNCDASVNITMNENRTNGSCSDAYTLTRVWTATDNCGNTSTASQVITVQDRTAPIFANVPQNITVECANIPTATNPTATDNCDASVNITMNEVRTNGTCTDNYTLTRVWTATDNCGNTATASQVITVEDRTAPILANVPQNVTVACGNIPNPSTPSVTDNCDAAPRITMAETRQNGLCNDAYNIIRTWTASDACGNTATASQIITVEDRIAPIFANVPQNTTIECHQISALQQPTATDNCDTQVQIALNEIRTNGTCTDNYTLTRTWTATDNCGNTATVSQVVTVEDRTAPILANVPQNITVECDQIPFALNPTATDNCDANVNIAIHEVRTNGTCTDNYTLTRTWTATDNCGNSATASQVITVKDRVAPVLANVPQNITVQCEEIPTVINPIASDNCDIAPRITMQETRIAATCANAYTLVRTWTATDACGNTATASQTITTLDRTAPILVNLPNNVTLRCDEPMPTNEPRATDNCDQNPRITFFDRRRNGNCAYAYEVVRTWVATDACGNTATAEQRISVGDNVAPILANVPQNITVRCDQTLPTPTTPSVTDNCDAAPRVTLQENRINGTCVGNYSIVRVWTATDACGNTSSASQTVTVQDTQAPILAAAPANITISCEDRVPAPVTLTATDLCDANPRVTMGETRQNDICPNRYVLTRIWTATDACGNTATASQTITVEDRTAPILTDVPQNMTINCGVALPIAVTPTLTDNCDVAPRVILNERRVEGNCAGNYQIIRTWTATDACGNVSSATQTLTIQDNEAPTLAGVPTNVTLTCTDPIPTPSIVQAQDVCDATPRVAMTERRIDGNCAGKYEIIRTWTATDACGNTATASQTITIQDIVPPTLAGVPQNTSIECGQTIPTAATTITASDVCDASPRVTMTETRIDGRCAGNYELVRTWTATDACGNTATASQVISVGDNTPPVLTNIPPNTTLNCDDNSVGSILVGAVDNCDPNVRIIMNDVTVRGNCVGSYVITRTWTAYDVCGNSASASQIITVGDPIPPVFVTAPQDITLDCSQTVPTPALPTVRDNCDRAPRIVYTQRRVDGNCATSYQLVRTWVATDACGNATTHTQTISVGDNQPPTLAGVPADATVSCTDVIPTPTVTATDRCDRSPRVAMAERRENGNCSGNYVLVRTWTATDACGNTNTGVQRITVQDRTAPTFANVPQNTTVSCGSAAANLTPSVTDACDTEPRITMAERRINGTCIGNYQVIRTWTASDNCGNTSTASQTLTFRDTEAPNLVGVPQNITLNCEQTVPTAAIVTATDSCDTAPRVALAERRENGTCANNYTLIRTWIATDACGNTRTASQTIAVRDTAAPLLTQVPENVTINCGVAIPAVGNPVATDNCSVNVNITYNQARQNGNCANSYTLIRTWTATDACGNRSTATQTLSIGDNEAPTFVSVPENITLNCNDNVPTVGTPVIRDNCDAAPTMAMLQTREDGNCAGSYRLIRTWTATDNCGNTRTASQVISVGDNAAPTFVNVPQNISVNCGQTVPTPATPSVRDNCDNNARVTFNETRENGNCAGSYRLIRTWTATDACGNTATASQVLTVGDFVAPIFANVPQNVTLNCGQTIPTATNPTITDNCDATPRVTMAERRVDGTCAGSYRLIRTWTATDICGNTSTASQTISVIDNTPPTLANVPQNVTLNCNQTVPNGLNVTATDLCSTQGVRVTMNDIRVNGSCAFTYSITRTWTATDACGNTATASQSITVRDNIAPAFANVPQDITVSCGTAEPAVVNPTITDNCDVTPRLSRQDRRENGTCVGSYKIVRIWTASDACGNTSTVSQTVTIGDNNAPTFANVPQNVTVACGSTTVPAVITPTISDNCDQNPRLTFNEVRENGNCASAYRLIRTWTASDACGNTRTASQVVSVGDNQAPILRGVPSNVTLACGATLPNGNVVTATDNCDENVRITMNDVTTRGNCTGAYTITRTWTATDACGNTATAAQRISVGDNIAPTLVGIPANVSIQCGQTIPRAANVRATDACDNAPRIAMVETRVSGSCVDKYQLVRTWTASDACGNTSTGSQVISVEDTQAPSLAGVPLDITVDSEAAIPTVPSNVFATDNCDTRVDLTFEERRVASPCGYDVIRTWRATDNCGNTKLAKQIIVVGIEPAVTFSVQPEQCANRNGSVSFTPSVYNFAWSDGRGGASRNDLTSGTYTVTVTNINNCRRVYTVNVPSRCDCQQPIVTVNKTNVTSCTSNNGAISLNLFGNLSEYRFIWSPNISTTNTASNLQAGAYTVRVERVADAQCATNVRVEIQNTAGNVIVPTPTITAATCNAGGRVAFPALGDSIRFRWSDGTTTATRDNVAAGTYMITVTNANTSCSKVIDVIVPLQCACDNPSVTVTKNNVTSCTSNNGSIALAVSNATNVTYTWSPNVSATHSATNLAAGIYTVRVARTDVQNCATNLTIEILNHAQPLTLPTPTITAATCDRLGSCSFNMGDSIRFTWSDGSTGRTRDLSAGTYTVTATHITTNCSATTQIVIVRNCACTPPIVNVSKTDVTCGNTADGSITLSIGGTGSALPHTYAWSPNVSTTSSANNLRAGTYIIRVSKANDTCSALVSVVVSSPRMIEVADAVVTPASCQSPTGRAEFQNVSDSLRFRWSDGGLGRARDSLRTGTYTVTITQPNSNACSIIRTVQVGTVNPLNTTFTILNQPSCGRLNGGVLLTTTGGSGRYIYSWGEGNVRFVLASGNHSVTATDLATGCTSVVTFTLTNQTITATLAMDSVITTSCNAMADARLNYTMTTSSNFINPAKVEIRDLSGRLYTNGLLGIGNYVVSVKDSSGCMAAERRFQVVEPTPIVENMRKRNHICDSLGYITFNPIGGAGRFRYDWADLAGTNDPRDRDNLVAGLYTVTITDANGCSKILRNIQVKDSCACRTPRLDSVLVTNAGCGRNNGAATLVLRGSVDPAAYFYTWQPDMGTPIGAGNGRSGLAGGVYTVFVTARNNANCSAVFSVGVGNAEGPRGITVQTTPATCQLANGSASLSPIADTLVYTWLHDNRTGASRTDLAAGVYQVMVTNRRMPDCPAVISVTVPQRNVLTALAVINTPASCGLPNGVATIQVRGGSGAYRFNWGADSVRRDLRGGVYTVAATDNQTGCIAQATFTMTENIPSIAKVSLQDSILLVTCEGMRNARVTYTTLFSPNFASPARITIEDELGRVWGNDSLAVGRYCVIVRDANGCVAGSKCFEVRNPTPIRALASKVNKTCNAEGSISLAVAGGTGTYTYTWSDLSSLNQPRDRQNLGTGTYSVTIYDSNGCSFVIDTITIRNECTINNICQFNVNATLRNASCTEGGNITLNLSNGIAPYNFDWADLAGTTNPQNRSQLVTGAYRVTVTDAAGCKDTVENLVIQRVCIPTILPPSIANVEVTSANCGLMNGSIMITMASNEPVTFTWSPNVSTSNVANNLQAGVYRVRITHVSDVNSFVEREIIITNQDGPVVGQPIVTPATCGASNGRVMFPATGTNLNYAWSDNRQGSVRNDLAAGDYRVTVTNPMNPTCPTIVNVSVGNNSTLTTSATVVTRPTCGAATGRVRINVSGGSGSYLYTFNNANLTSNLLTNVAAGTYNVTVTDQQTGCVSVVPFTLNEQTQTPVTINVARNIVFTSCSGMRDGRLDYEVIYPSGFVTPANISIVSTVNGLTYRNDSLPIGTYNLVVRDGNNCITGITPFEVRENAPMIATATTTPQGCNIPAGLGRIALTVSGGNGFYNFRWSDSSTVTAQNRDFVRAGTYRATISDTRGCSVTLNNIAVANTCSSSGCDMVVNAMTQNRTCTEGGKIGLMVSAQGAGRTYTFRWSDLGTAPNQPKDRLNIAPGTYSVTVTSVAGSVGTNCDTILRNLVVRDDSVNCGGGNTICNLRVTATATSKTCTTRGTITLNVNTFATPVTFRWSDGSTAQNRMGLNSGIYTVTISDANRCDTILRNIEVRNDSVNCTTTTCNLRVVATATPKTCNGRGSIFLAVNSGSQPFTFRWADGSTLQNRMNLDAGTYTVTVSDANRCDTILRNIEVRNDSVNCGAVCGLRAIATATPQTCTARGAINLAVSGFTNTASYVWSDGATVQNRSNLVAGTYTVTVTDARCDTIIRNIIVRNDSVNCGGGTICNIRLIDTTVNATCTEGGKVRLGVIGGLAPYRYLWQDGDTNRVRTNLAANSYRVIVTDSLRCKDTLNIIITRNCTQPVCSLVARATSTPLTCTTRGTAQIIVTNGVSPYTFRWSDGSTMQNRTNMSAGIYVVTVSDANSCDTVLRNITIRNDSVNCGGGTICNIRLIDTTVNATCTEGGKVRLGVIGGLAPYRYLWQDGDTNRVRTNLAANTYRVIVTDSLRCKDTLNIIITRNCTQPVCSLAVSAITTPQTCTALGTITVNATNGLAPYTFRWSDGATTQNRPNMVAGSYILTITDARGCDTVISNIVVRNERINCPVICNIDLRDTTVQGTCTVGGSVRLGVIGGLAPYRYLWQDGDTNRVRTNLAPATYRVIVTDSLRCKDTLDIMIARNCNCRLAIANVIATPQTCTARGSIAITTTNGTGTLTFRWSDIGVGSASRTNLAAGFYSVTVTDANNCVAVANDISVRNDSVNCNGTICSKPRVTPTVRPRNCTEGGIISLNVANVTPTYTVRWSDMNVTQNILTRSNLSVGAYSVTVSNSATCDTVLRFNIGFDSINCSRDTFCSAYDGSTNVYVAHCDSMASICTNIKPEQTANWNITVNGLPYMGGLAPCAADTLNWYTYFTLTTFYPRGPYTVQSWLVNGRTYSGTVANINALVDSMNRWDPTGNWTLNTTARVIIGGDTRKAYGDMQFVRGSRVVATFRLNQKVVPTKVAMRLDTGRYTVIFRNRVEGCADTVSLTVRCNNNNTISLPNRVIDTLLYVGQERTICLDNYGMSVTRSTITNNCAANHRGNANYTIQDNTDCIRLVGANVGTDTLCLVRCWAGNLCDTITIRVNVRRLTPLDSGCIRAYTGPTRINNCGTGLTTLCTNLFAADTANYRVLLNGQPYSNFVACGNDTVRSYTYFSLTFNYRTGPYTLSNWTVNGRSYSAIIPNMEALKDSMNRWDPTGGWIHEPTAYSIKGGNPQTVYGNMEFSRNGRVIARFSPNRQIIQSKVALRVPNGTHLLTFQNLRRNCPLDTVRVLIGCGVDGPLVPNSRIDTIVQVGREITVCPRTVNGLTTQTTLTNVCVQNYRGRAVFTFNETTDCVVLRGASMGNDTICVRRCNPTTGFCDTISIFVRVIATPRTDCQPLYSGSDTLRVPSCTQGGFITLNTWGVDTSAYTFALDGSVVRNYTVLAHDTLTAYTYFTLTSIYRAPYTLQSWRVGSRELSGTFTTMRQLTDSMNRWDVGGGWVLDSARMVIRGGRINSSQYGQMKFVRNGFNVATFAPNRQYIPRQIAIRVDTGRHQLVTYNSLNGCRDSVRLTVLCNTGSVARGIRNVQTINIVKGNMDTVCLPAHDRFSSTATIITTLCRPQLTYMSATVSDDTDCVTFNALTEGSDSICLLRCYPSAVCDTFIIRVNVIPRRPAVPRLADTIVRYIALRQDSTFCLPNAIVNSICPIRNICDPNSSNAVNFIIEPNRPCVTYLADAIGSDTACLVWCNANGTTDTTVLIVHVSQRSLPPIARDDRGTTTKTAILRINSIRNDSLWGAPATIRVLTQPIKGFVTPDPYNFGYFSYTYTAEKCEPRDSFTYIVENGWGADTATVHIEVICDDVIIYSGFSPNDDNQNDVFVILGIEKYPNSKLLIFNRWGNQVFEALNYKNNWNGTFEGKPLPDGTYFYMLDLGNGTQKTGYLQIHR